MVQRLRGSWPADAAGLAPAAGVDLGFDHDAAAERRAIASASVGVEATSPSSMAIPCAFSSAGPDTRGCSPMTSRCGSGLAAEGRGTVVEPRDDRAVAASTHERGGCFHLGLHPALVHAAGRDDLIHLFQREARQRPRRRASRSDRPASTSMRSSSTSASSWWGENRRDPILVDDGFDPFIAQER